MPQKVGCAGSNKVSNSFNLHLNFDGQMSRQKTDKQTDEITPISKAT